MEPNIRRRVEHYHPVLSTLPNYMDILPAQNPSGTFALAKAGVLLDGSAIDTVASWADGYRRDRRETGPWYNIDIP